MFKDKIRTLSFPIAAAINLFSITSLVIIAGLFGQGELASDMAIIQGAVLVIFLSLSGNARNLILSRQMQGIESELFQFRLMFLAPAAVAAFLLSTQIIETPIYLVLGLLLRKCSEWLAEIKLADLENDQSYNQAIRYSGINIILFLVLIISLLFLNESYFLAMLFIWGLYPVLFVGHSYMRGHKASNIRIVVRKLMPNLGSSIVIGVSTYIFRLLIIMLAGKELAGIMISSYALGGVVSAVYTYAIGPSLMLNKAAGMRKLFGSMALCCLTGGGIVLLSWLIEHTDVMTRTFLFGVGFSLIGGGVMLLAQHQRLVILQVIRGDVFVPDALANILLIASIPFAYFIIGKQSLVMLFLWSALLNLLFYALLSHKHSMQEEGMLCPK